MKKLLARYLEDFNRHEWFAPREEPGPVSTLIVIAVIFAVAAFFCWR